MDVAELYARVETRLPEEFMVTTKELVHAVLVSLAERLSPDAAAELGAELPEELGDLLAAASGDGELKRDDLIEDVAARLDLDDESAETGTSAVLVGLREALEPMVSIEQVLETLPPDLAQLMR
jgi:uncharacterized protein (DUF2267 family)